MSSYVCSRESVRCRRNDQPRTALVRLGTQLQRDEQRVSSVVRTVGLTIIRLLHRRLSTIQSAYTRARCWRPRPSLPSAPAVSSVLTLSCQDQWHSPRFTMFSNLLRRGFSGWTKRLHKYNTIAKISTERVLIMVVKLPLRYDFFLWTVS